MSADHVATESSADSGAAPDDPYEISCVIPDGIAIKPTKYGLGIFTTREFLPNEVLYTGVYYNIDDFGYDRPLLLKTNQGNYQMTTEMHTVGIGHGTEIKQRQLFTFDSFMNHSCDPNTFSADEHETVDGGTYKTVALRRIEANEQITCDYDLFEYDSRMKGIEKCECQSKFCRGASLGFSFLSTDAQLNLLNRAYPEVINSWLANHPNILYRQVTVPQGFAYRQSAGGDDLHLIATKSFVAGEILHSYSTEYFDSNRYDIVILNVETAIYDDKNQLLINPVATGAPATGGGEGDEPDGEECRVSVSSSNDDPMDLPAIATATTTAAAGLQTPVTLPSSVRSDDADALTADARPREMWYEPTRIIRKLDLITHTVNRGNGLRECFGWDTFCNHSCEPNADFQYLCPPGTSSTESESLFHETQTIARKEIQFGDMITCDYTSFDTELDGSEFICQCGAPSCQGVIRG
jgi:hypothetical protein